MALSIDDPIVRRSWPAGWYGEKKFDHAHATDEWFTLGETYRADGGEVTYLGYTYTTHAIAAPVFRDTAGVVFWMHPDDVEQIGE